MPPLRRTGLAVVCVAAVTLTACGSNTAPSPPVAASAPPAVSAPMGQPSGRAVADHNDADVAFAQQMIPRHAQAVALAEMAVRAGSVQVRDLGAQIQPTVRPEMDQMAGWLRSWGAEVPPTTGFGGGPVVCPGGGVCPSGGPGPMPGGMGPGRGPSRISAEQIQEMGRASGPQFDRRFLQLMIEHHREAITIAETEVRDGRSTEATQLAEKIITEQQAEIGQMETLLAQR
jgi:uncharacterized protein (DUF305 family)